MKEITFTIDLSGSMFDGGKLQMATLAVHATLFSLAYGMVPDEDYHVNLAYASDIFESMPIAEENYLDNLPLPSGNAPELTREALTSISETGKQKNALVFFFTDTLPDSKLSKDFYTVIVGDEVEDTKLKKYPKACHVQNLLSLFRRILEE